MVRKARITGETSVRNVVAERYGGKGRTLGSYLAEANGFDLSFGDSYGGKHIISLAPFAGEDPDRFLMLTVVVAHEGKDLAPVHGDTVVLKEYDLPPDAELPEITPWDRGDSTFLERYKLPPDVKMIGE
jgi:hypothetical protein